ncbi:MAG: DUF362 domain-containing protein [candidate division Zixibacteria bacterium]|nr:DUF362 domain-containing protein [candidate division Zixibacteria bacterium]
MCNMLDLPKTRVAIVACDSYKQDILDEKIEELLDLLGGLDKYIKPGMRVLLKPNLLSAKEPARAITTHPEIVAAVARKVRELGAEVIVGDSPGGAKRGVQRVWENTGMLAMAERENIRLVNFESGGVVRFEINGKSYHLAKHAVEADFIISLPKLKTHVLTLMTGGVKNMFGLIPGFRKGEYHKEAPKPNDFAQILVDILSLKPPGLTIMDAVLAMEGDGPSSGTPRWANLLLASPDAVAIDAVASEIIGLKPDRVPTTRIASEAGLGIAWPEALDIVGEKVVDIRFSDFKLTSNRKIELIPGILTKLLGRYIWVRPAISENSCTRCDICANSCPTGALSKHVNGVPTFDYEKCINCWCCHELCPSKSVFVNQSWLAKKFIR